MTPLNQIEIAKPCHASWDAMAGGETVRFCTQCSRNVYNLSAMTADQARALVSETEGKLCVRFYRRKDGTVLTSDCPIGVRIARRRSAATRSWAVSLTIASVMGTSLFTMSRGQATMGAPIAIQTTPYRPDASKKHAKAAPKPRSVKKPHTRSHTFTPLMGKIAMPTRPPKLSSNALMGGATPPPGLMSRAAERGDH